MNDPTGFQLTIQGKHYDGRTRNMEFDIVIHARSIADNPKARNLVDDFYTEVFKFVRNIEKTREEYESLVRKVQADAED